MDDITVTDNKELSRFEGRLADGTLAGFADYRLEDGVIVFPHTIVDPAFEGQGVGSAIVRFALDSVRADGTRAVVATCSFVERWMQRHPDYLVVCRAIDS